MDNTLYKNVEVRLPIWKIKNLLNGIDPNTKEGEERLQEIAQYIIDSYCDGMLITKEESNKLASEAASRAIQNFDPDDIRFHYGPGGR